MPRVGGRRLASARAVASGASGGWAEQRGNKDHAAGGTQERTLNYHVAPGWQRAAVSTARVALGSGGKRAGVGKRAGHLRRSLRQARIEVKKPVTTAVESIRSTMIVV